MMMITAVASRRPLAHSAKLPGAERHRGFVDEVIAWSVYRDVDLVR